MGKQSDGLRLEIVRRYELGKDGYKALAAEYGVAKEQLRRWIAVYREHGKAGLLRSNRGQPYSAEFKLDVLRQARRQGLSNERAAVLFNLRGGGGVVAQWRRQYDEGGPQALHPKPRGRPSMKLPKPTAVPAVPAKADDQRTLEELRKENELLRTEVAYLKKLDALVRVRPSAAPKGRKPSSS